MLTSSLLLGAAAVGVGAQPCPAPALVASGTAVSLTGLLGEPPQAETVRTGSFPGSMLWPGSDVSIRIGGRIKADAIQDFDAIGTTDEFKTSAIPVPEAASDGNSDFHAQDSRLHVEVRTPSDLGELRGYVEANFWGNELTLRHAYAQTPNLLVGQTWTNFMMIDSRPDTLDFEGPDGSVFLRQAQVRWTQPLAERLHGSIALEDPASNVSGPGGSTPEQALPDLTAGLRGDFARGHAYLSGVLRQVGYKGAGSEDVTGWGLQASGEVKTSGQSNVRFQLAYGQGIARYIEDLRGSNLDAALDANGDLQALDTWGAFLAYQHYWAADLRSSAMYSTTGIDPTNAQAGGTLESTSYVAANLIWTAATHFEVGVEYLYGTRENKDGDDADANRVQVSFIYSF